MLYRIKFAKLSENHAKLTEKWKAELRNNEELANRMHQFAARIDTLMWECQAAEEELARIRMENETLKEEVRLLHKRLGDVTGGTP